MAFLKGAVFGFGILMMLVGAIWIGQGSGHFPYPSVSVMINQPQWMYRGIALVIVGTLIAAGSRKI
jgi:hypothetical protein